MYETKQSGNAAWNGSVETEVGELKPPNVSLEQL